MHVNTTHRENPLLPHPHILIGSMVQEYLSIYLETSFKWRGALIAANAKMLSASNEARKARDDEHLICTIKQYESLYSLKAYEKFQARWRQWLMKVQMKPALLCQGVSLAFNTSSPLGIHFRIHFTARQKAHSIIPSSVNCSVQTSLFSNPNPLCESLY